MSAHVSTPLDELWFVPAGMLCMLAVLDLASAALLLYALPPSSIVHFGCAAWSVRAVFFFLAAHHIWRRRVIGHIYTLGIGLGLWMVQVSTLQHWLGASEFRRISGVFLFAWAALAIVLLVAAHSVNRLRELRARRNT